MKNAFFREGGKVHHMHPIQHFKTVYEHRKLVREHCFKLGLYRQGIMHDLSKYSPVEFWRGAKYYQGNRSPNNKEREVTGRSMAWLHHKGRNKHHFEYWIDYMINDDGSVGFGGNRMPKKYIAEMFCDRVIHPDTAAELDRMLLVLKEEGEDAAFEYIRKWLKE